MISLSILIIYRFSQLLNPIGWLSAVVENPRKLRGEKSTTPLVFLPPRLTIAIRIVATTQKTVERVNEQVPDPACDSSPMTLALHGAQLFAAALDESELHEIETALADLPEDQAGLRLHGIGAVTPHLDSSGAIGRVAGSALGSACRPVRAVLFDKTAANNWSLAWHQDRTIAVAERLEVDGFGPWSIKNGMHHVAPPIEILAGMVTLRLHLDAVPATNAPLLVAPGSHRRGRIAESDVAQVVAECGSFACLATRGDIWLYATPILHASEAAREPNRRRVLQVDFAAGDLPGGLRWLGM
jgi:Phytanoyl-CoA dioxygenase (PhyH)